MSGHLGGTSSTHFSPPYCQVILDLYNKFSSSGKSYLRIPIGFFLGKFIKIKKMEQTTNIAPCWRTILHGSLVLLYNLPCMSGMQGRVTFKQDLGLGLQQKTFKDQVISL